MKKSVIIGTGAIAWCHAKAMQALGVKIIGVYDIREEAAIKLAEFCGCAAITRQEELEKALQEADLINLCTPPSFRVSYTDMAAKAGCHVITEKPMAVKTEDAEQMIAVCKENGVKLMVDFNHRFRRGFEELKKIVDSGELGEITEIFIHRIAMLGGNAGTANDTWRRKAGSVCGMSIESLSHDLDMITTLGGPIRDVKANIRGTFEDVPEFDNNVQATLNLASGAMASIHASWSSTIKGSARGLIGTKGTVILEGDDLFDFKTLRVKTAGMEQEEIIDLEDIYHFDTCPSYTNILRYMLACMDAGDDSTVSGLHGLEILDASHAILDAAREDRTMSVPDRTAQYSK